MSSETEINRFLFGELAAIFGRLHRIFTRLATGGTAGGSSAHASSIIVKLNLALLEAELAVEAPINTLNPLGPGPDPTSPA